MVSAAAESARSGGSPMPFCRPHAVATSRGLLAVLAPDVIRPADPGALPPGRLAEIRGVGAVVKEAIVFGRGAAVAEVALIDGIMGIVAAPWAAGRSPHPHFGEDGISRYSVIANPTRLARLSISLLDCLFVR